MRKSMLAAVLPAGLLYGLAQFACAAGDPPVSPKTLLMQGKRKEAVDELDRARSRAKSGKEAQALLEKRKIFLEQFMTAESFQRYQGSRFHSKAKRWAECLKELDLAAQGDQDNRLVMSMRALCLKGSGQPDAAIKLYNVLWQLDPGDVASAMGLAEIALEQKRFEDGLQVLQSTPPATSADVERCAIFKARLLDGAGRFRDAVETLRVDQEKYIEHVQVIFELGSLYYKKPGSDWMARKYLTLFASRCRRIGTEELKERGMETQCRQAQEWAAELDKKLGF